jgi:Domain of unknown function (DUF4185)
MNRKLSLGITLICACLLELGPAPSSISLADDPQPALPAFGKAEPMPAMDALFRSTDGWIGADGAHSVALTDQRTLWLFSDTWVGKIRNGKRTDATMVNNTLAIQEGRGSKLKVEFVIRHGADGKATSFITPADGKGFYWLQAGAMADKKAILFLSQIEKTAAGGAFGFKQVGQWLGIVSNPLDAPLSWKIEQQKLPCVIFDPKRTLTWGAALLVDGDYLYIYGTDEDARPHGPDRHLVLARVPLKEATNVSAWRFYGKDGWKTDFHEASRISNEMASEGSVTYIPALKHYVLIYTQIGLSDKIRARTAPNPWGPWSLPVTVFQCPDMSWDKRIFCYAAKAHGEQTTANELIVTYAANSFDFWHVAADARLYWPRFVRVPIIGEE